MIIKVTIFNDPKMLGKSAKRRNIKTNYAFMVHDGVAEHTGIRFHSWAKATKGQVKVYKKPVHRKARKAIDYFGRAIKQVMPETVTILARYTDINIINNKMVLDIHKLVAGYTFMANKIKETAMNILKAEAFDTGDLMSSVSVSEVQILMEEI